MINLLILLNYGGIFGLPARYIMWVLILHFFLPTKTKIMVYSLYNFVQQDRSPVKLCMAPDALTILQESSALIQKSFSPHCLAFWPEKDEAISKQTNSFANSRKSSFCSCHKTSYCVLSMEQTKETKKRIVEIRRGFVTRS